MHHIVDVGIPSPRRAPVPCPKVRVPRASTNLVLRPHLLQLLSSWADEDPGRDIAFVCAPAGSGKTTLLSEWARRVGKQPGTAVAWVSLEHGDDDVHGLWSAVLAALDASAGQGEASPVGGLNTPAHGFSPGFLSAFLDAFEGPGPRTFLVLDDVHELRDLQTLHSLDLLLRRLPARLKVVMAARFTPALSLPRLGLAGRLLGIDTAALAFTVPEATALLAGHGVDLDPEALQLLLDCTEGWAAGLRLAAMSLSCAEDPAGLVATFAANDRAVADYLVGEVLARQDGPTRLFLLQTSVPSMITAELARELTGRDDAGAVLDELDRSNSFVVRLGAKDGWYRHHPMLRQYLLAELSRQQPDQVGVLHRQAARWFAAHDDTTTAVEHAVAAVDADLTASLLEEFGVQQVLRGHGTGLHRVLLHAPDDVARRPGVALVSAAVALESGDPTAAAASLAAMSPTGRGSSEFPRRLRGLQALTALQGARLDGDASAAREALATAPASTGDADLDLLVQLHRGIVLGWLGDVDAAEAELRRAMLVARATEREWVVLQGLSQLTSMAFARSDMAAVQLMADEAVTLSRANGWTGSAPHAAVALPLAWAAYQRLDQDGLDAVMPAVQRLVDEGQADSAHFGTVLQAVVAFDGTENRHALVATTREAWHQRPAGHLPPWLVAGSALIEQRMALQVGEPAWAGEVTERAEALLGDCGEVSVLQAVGQVHRGRTDAARRLLTPVVAKDLTCVLPLTLLEALLWDARLAARAHDAGRAHLSVLEALTLGASHGLMRPFVAGGPELHDLLAGDAGRFGRLEDFAERMRTACASPAHRESVELLTTRELELLVELPSLRTAEEIAASMFVSVNTVKTHLRAIYRKLGVANRREAIVLARRRGLI